MEQEIITILKRMEKSMQKMNDNLDTMHDDVNIIKSSINAIKSDVTDIKSDVDTIKTNITTIDKIQSTSSLHALEEIVKQNCYDIACLKAKSKNF